MMLMFVHVFGGEINSGSDSYVGYLLPGILLITVASGIAYTSLRLFTDMRSGVFERFQSMPVGGDIWIALAWCVGILAIAYVFAMVSYRRKIS